MGKVLLNCHNGLFWPLKVGDHYVVLSLSSSLIFHICFFSSHFMALTRSIWVLHKLWIISDSDSLDEVCHPFLSHAEAKLWTQKSQHVPTMNQSQENLILWDLHHHLTSIKSAHLSLCFPFWNCTMSFTTVFNWAVSPTPLFTTYWPERLPRFPFTSDRNQRGKADLHFLCLSYSWIQTKV